MDFLPDLLYYNPVMQKINELLNRSRPKALYHYTSFSGLMGIIESKSIWATDIKFLNDHKEFSHAASFAKDVILNCESSFANQETRQMLIGILEKQILSGEGLTVCVSSFSEKADLLSQWRGYCPGGQGVCIGFSTDKIAEALGDIEWSSVAPCEYEEPAQRDLVADALSEVVEIFRTPNLSSFSKELKQIAELRKAGGNANLAKMNQIAQTIADETSEKVRVATLTSAKTLFRVAALLKHNAFKEETEWRATIPMFASNLEANVYKWKFRVVGSALVPHIALALGSDDSHLGLSEVIVGPSKEPALLLNSVRRLLSTYGLSSAIVRTSDVPYRNW